MDYKERLHKLVELIKNDWPDRHSITNTEEAWFEFVFAIEEKCSDNSWKEQLELDTCAYKDWCILAPQALNQFIKDTKNNCN